MANKYSRLLIDSRKISDWILFWCEENLSDPFTIDCNEISTRFQYSIVSGNNTIKIDFIKCKGGLLTIAPNVGSHTDISTQIADSIYDRVKYAITDSPFANGFSVLLGEDDFSTIIELLCGDENITLDNYSEQLNPGQAQYKLYRFTGAAGDSVTVKYYLSTKRMQLQGKPLSLFTEIVAMVSECVTTVNDVVDAHLRYCSLNIPRDDIYEEMKNSLGSEIFSFLSTTQKSLLATTFILDKIELDMPDYSGLITPALRAFEGYTKKLFAQQGLQCDGDKQLGEFFERSSKTEPFCMKNSYSSKLDADIERKLTAMYDFYYRNRHPYAHASAYDFTTTIISDRKAADEIFQEIIQKMKSCFVA